MLSSGKCGKIISHECEWAFHKQLFAAGALWIGRSCFILYKEKVALNIKIKFMRFNAKGRPFD
jgi:hypothetical protein